MKSVQLITFKGSVQFTGGGAVALPLYSLLATDSRAKARIRAYTIISNVMS